MKRSAIRDCNDGSPAKRGASSLAARLLLQDGIDHLHNEALLQKRCCRKGAGDN
jgi:hypothetical protein